MSDSDQNDSPWLRAVSAGAGLAPGIGTAKGIVEAWTGEDLLTGEELSWWERGLGVLPIVGGIGKGAAVGADVVAIVDKTSDAATAAARAEELAQTAKAGRDLHRVATAVDTNADWVQFADALDDAVAASTAAAVDGEPFTVKDIAKAMVEFVFDRGQGTAPGTDASASTDEATGATEDGAVCEPSSNAQSSILPAIDSFGPIAGAAADPSAAPDQGGTGWMDALDTGGTCELDQDASFSGSGAIAGDPASIDAGEFEEP